MLYKLPTGWALCQLHTPCTPTLHHRSSYKHCRALSRESNMEQVNFGHSVKNVPVHSNKDYLSDETPQEHRKVCESNKMGGHISS